MLCCPPCDDSQPRSSRLPKRWPNRQSRQCGYEGLYGRPLACCRYLNDHPCIIALTGIYPIGGVFRVVIAIPLRRLAVHGLVQNALGCERQQAFHLAEIDKLALAGTLLVPQRRQNGGCTVNPPIASPKATCCILGATWVTTKWEGPRNAVNRRREIPTKDRYCQGGHGNHNQLRIGLVQAVELELGQHAAKVISTRHPPSPPTGVGSRPRCSRSNVTLSLLRFTERY